MRKIRESEKEIIEAYRYKLRMKRLMKVLQMWIQKNPQNHIYYQKVLPYKEGKAREQRKEIMMV